MNLEELRKKVDEADIRIIELLNQRYAAVMEIGKIKRSRMQPVYVPEREKIIYEKVSALNRGRMNEATLHAIYREIMSGALMLEHPLKIAYPGPAYSNTYQAAVHKFGQSVTYLALDSADDVITCLTNDRADYGCIHFETLPHTLPPDVQICAESILQEYAGTSTRFFVLGKQSSQPTGNDKTLLSFKLKNGINEISEILSFFQTEIITVEQKDGISFMELCGHRDDPAILPLLKKLVSISSELHVLGSYPCSGKAE